MVNRKSVTVFLDLGYGVACNTIFSWPFLQINRASITTNNNYLVSGLLVEQFRLDMIVPQIYKEPPKKSKGIPVSFEFSIQGKQENTKERISRNIRVELKKTVTQQRQIPGQN